MEPVKEQILDFLPVDYFTAQTEPRIVTYPELHYLGIAGTGSPSDSGFAEAVGKVYEAAGSLLQRQDAYSVLPMEAFWWVESGRDFMQTPPEEWHWEVLLPMPARLQTRFEGLSNQDLEWKILPESRYVEILHQGSYEKEAPSIVKMMALVQEKGLRVAGQHREIYLTDPHNTPEDQLMTILRYQVG